MGECEWRVHREVWASSLRKMGEMSSRKGQPSGHSEFLEFLIGGFIVGIMLAKITALPLPGDCVADSSKC